MTREFVCIICPNGCEISVEMEDGEIISTTGAQCKRGVEYVNGEIHSPMRTLSTSVMVDGGDMPLASVRLTAPIPKDRIMDFMAEVKTIHLKAPVSIGQVVMNDVCGTNSQVIITKNVDAASK